MAQEYCLLEGVLWKQVFFFKGMLHLSEDSSIWFLGVLLVEKQCTSQRKNAIE